MKFIFLVDSYFLVLMMPHCSTDDYIDWYIYILKRIFPLCNSSELIYKVNGSEYEKEKKNIIY